MGVRLAQDAQRFGPLDGISPVLGAKLGVDMADVFLCSRHGDD